MYRTDREDPAQLNGVALAFHWFVKVSIIEISSLTLPKLPRRIAWRVRMPNQVSIWFIREAEVGVTWKVNRV